MKKILSLVLALVMLTALVACSKGFEAADADDVTALNTRIAILEQKQKDMEERAALSTRIAVLEEKVKELEEKGVPVTYIPTAQAQTVAPVEAAPVEPAAEPAAEPADAEVEPDFGYTIRIYSNSNSTERVTWLVNEAKAAGFDISLDDNATISGDSAAIQAANENKDGDIIFGLNESRWAQLIKGQYENLSIMDWTPTWADQIADNCKYDGKAYGLVIQNVLMLYRTDEFGTNGEALHFAHWADLVDSGYTWYRQNKVGGTTNNNLNSSILFPFVDPSSPAGGISIDGWKTLWKYCAEGKFSSDDSYKYGFDPLNKGDVAVSSFYSSSLYGKIDAAANSSDHPLLGTLQPENWALAEIDDGTYYITEYLGILDKAGRTPEQTAAVYAFAEWFGSAEIQAAWGEEFDSYPCNAEAAAELYDETPAIYQIPNMGLTPVEGTDMIYAEYVGAHLAEWTNILTNLGFYWKDAADAPTEPDWDNLDWATLTQKAA
ncbi:MAG: ABC transporter substrate-binding protein [Oscillospiraceae bacterium]|nr:ABC transporter substrate-binding protein [Oscillospiraceae bacterium]